MKVLAINGSARKDGNTANISENMQAFLERASVVTDMNRDAKLFWHKVGSSYWNMAYGQMPGDVLQDSEGINTMKNLGQNMAYLLKVLDERRNG